MNPIWTGDGVCISIREKDKELTFDYKSWLISLKTYSLIRPANSKYKTDIHDTQEVGMILSNHLVAAKWLQ